LLESKFIGSSFKEALRKTRTTSKANTIKVAIQYLLRLELDKRKSRGT
jgi:hypothetical protein